MGRYPSARTNAHLLVVEPDPSLARLFETRLGDDERVETIRVTGDGETAREWLTQADPETPRPDLVLLDPQTGRHCANLLADLKDESRLQSIPVIVLATSATEEDVLQSYSLHANAYVQKPGDRDGFVDLIDSFREFWLANVRLPGPPA